MAAKKLKIESKFNEGQKVFFIQDNKIKSGTVTGLEACNFKTFYKSDNRIEVHVGIGQDACIYERHAFTSERALRRSLNGN